MAAERIRNRSGSGATGPMLRIVVVTMDTHLASATVSAARRQAARLPGASLEMHAASEFSASAERLAQCRAAIEAAETGHIVFGTLHTNSASSTINRRSRSP